jgi:hypothetical protein
MKATSKIVNGEPVAVIIGSETKLFFKRYAALESAGFLADAERLEALPSFAGDVEAFYTQVHIIREQAGVSLESRAHLGALGQLLCGLEN